MWSDYEISSVPFLLDLLHKKRGERNLTYTMTQKRQEGEFKSKYIAVNSSSVKEHRTPPRTTFQYGKRGLYSTLLANSQGPNGRLIHRVRHESTLQILEQRSRRPQNAAQFLCARRLFFPTAFSFELPGEARPLPFKPCPLSQIRQLWNV